MQNYTHSLVSDPWLVLLCSPSFISAFVSCILYPEILLPFLCPLFVTTRKNVKSFPGQEYYKRRGFQEFDDPGFQDTPHMNIVSTRRFTQQKIFMVLISVSGCVDPRPYATGRIMSMKDSNYTLGNQNRDFPACSAVPRPTVPPRAVG
jgi:hypothetical protein